MSRVKITHLPSFIKTIYPKNSDGVHLMRGSLPSKESHTGKDRYGMNIISSWLQCNQLSSESCNLKRNATTYVVVLALIDQLWSAYHQEEWWGLWILTSLVMWTVNSYSINKPWKAKLTHPGRCLQTTVCNATTSSSVPLPGLTTLGNAILIGYGLQIWHAAQLRHVKETEYELPRHGRLFL